MRSIHQTTFCTPFCNITTCNPSLIVPGSYNKPLSISLHRILSNFSNELPGFWVIDIAEFGQFFRGLERLAIPLRA